MNAPAGINYVVIVKEGSRIGKWSEHGKRHQAEAQAEQAERRMPGVKSYIAKWSDGGEHYHVPNTTMFFDEDLLDAEALVYEF